MKTVFPNRYILELPTFEYGCLVELNKKEGTSQKQGPLMSNHCVTTVYTMWRNLQYVTVVIERTAQSFVLKK